MQLCWNLSNFNIFEISEKARSPLSLRTPVQQFNVPKNYCFEDVFWTKFEKLGFKGEIAMFITESKCLFVNRVRSWGLFIFMIENAYSQQYVLGNWQIRIFAFRTKLDTFLLQGESKTQVMNFVGKRHKKLCSTSSPEISVECQRHQYFQHPHWTIFKTNPLRSWKRFEKFSRRSPHILANFLKSETKFSFVFSKNKDMLLNCFMLPVDNCFWNSLLWKGSTAFNNSGNSCLRPCILIHKLFMCFVMSTKKIRSTNQVLSFESIKT